MKIALNFVGTNKYINFFPNYYSSFNNMFIPSAEKHFFVYTDQTESLPDNTTKITIEHLGWPFITLFRFKYMFSMVDNFKSFDWVFFIDADMMVYRTINEEEFFSHNKDYIGVIHPGYIDKIGPYENRPESSAYVKFIPFVSTYRQGCFWGAKSENFIHMVTVMNNSVEEDLKKGVVAKWHDESHLNRFFLNNEDNVHNLPPSYAYPEREKKPYEKIIIHLYKPLSEYPRFEGIHT